MEVRKVSKNIHFLLAKLACYYGSSVWSCSPDDETHSIIKAVNLHMKVPMFNQFEYWLCILYIKSQRALTWPCMLMMTTVLERLQITKYSGFWGRGITLLTGTSDVWDRFL